MGKRPKLHQTNLVNASNYEESEVLIESPKQAESARNENQKSV